MSSLKMHRWTSSESREFDLLIIGGGITGATLAYESASRGYKTLLLEKGDFGAATSAATGKLIHGGLRYLKKLELGLVRESLRERRILSNIAPNLVIPYPILLPNPGLVERLGLLAYDLLSYDRNRLWDKSRRMPRTSKIQGERLRQVAPEGSAPESALRYFDCMCISPERLTLAFLKSAISAGASVANYMEARKFLIHEKRVHGAVAHDQIRNEEIEIRARCVVNATGPWVQSMLRSSTETSVPTPRVRSEGIYLITRKLSDEMYLFVSEHGHFSFAPWRNHTLIGPTDTPYHGDVSQWKVTEQSIQNFLKVINAAAPWVSLRREDVQFAYGGLRPLTETTDEDTYNASRKSELHDHAAEGVEGLITAAGGKYTTSRAFAGHIFDRVIQKVGKPAKDFKTSDHFLHGCRSSTRKESQDLHRHFDEFAPETIDYVLRHYGSEAAALLTMARTMPEGALPRNADGEILAEALFAVRNEMALGLDDVFFRRTGLGWLGHPGQALLQKVASIVGAELEWTESEKKSQVERVEERYRFA